MNHRLAMGASLAVVILCGYTIAGDLKSGPQPGERIPGAFNVLNVCNAERPSAVGKKTCLV